MNQSLSNCNLLLMCISSKCCFVFVSSNLIRKIMIVVYLLKHGYINLTKLAGVNHFNSSSLFVVVID